LAGARRPSDSVVASLLDDMTEAVETPGKPPKNDVKRTPSQTHLGRKEPTDPTYSFFFPKW